MSVSECGCGCDLAACLMTPDHTILSTIRAVLANSTQSRYSPSQLSVPKSATGAVQCKGLVSLIAVCTVEAYGSITAASSRCKVKESCQCKGRHTSTYQCVNTHMRDLKQLSSADTWYLNLTNNLKTSQISHVPSLDEGAQVRAIMQHSEGGLFLYS